MYFTYGGRERPFPTSEFRLLNSDFWVHIMGNFEILMGLKVIFHFFLCPIVSRWYCQWVLQNFNSTSDFRLPTSEFRLPGLLSSDVRVPSSNFWVPTSWTSEFRLPSSDFRLPTSDFRLPTSDFRFIKITTSEQHTANHVLVRVWTAKTPTLSPIL